MELNQLHQLLPNSFQRVAKRGYYIVNPDLNWRSPAIQEKRAKVTQALVSAHFTDFDEFERYKTEFADSKIPEICMEASKKVKHNQSIYDTHREECERFYALIRRYEPEHILLTGVFNGVLTLGILTALERNGHGTLHSICCSDRGDDKRGAFLDREGPSSAEPGSTVIPDGKQPGWIVPSSLEQNWNHMSTKSTASLASLLDELETVDMFFHNSEYSQSRMLFEFELVWEHLTSGGLMFSHHAGRNAACETFADERNANTGLVYWRHQDEHNGKTVYIRKPDARAV